MVAPGRMIDNFLPIPEAGFLPLYRRVLKLACVCGCPFAGQPPARASPTLTQSETNRLLLSISRRWWHTSRLISFEKIRGVPPLGFQSLHLLDFRGSSVSN